MLARMDAGVGRVVEALRAANQWGDTLLLFSTDNGGAVSMAGSNHPLRGTKGTLFEVSRMLQKLLSQLEYTKQLHVLGEAAS
jgi:arylsulfatase A-like enzyme